MKTKKTIISKIFEKEQHKELEKKILNFHIDSGGVFLEEFEQLIIERTLLELKTYMKHDTPYWKRRINLY